MRPVTGIEDALTAITAALRVLDGDVPVSAAEVTAAAAFLGVFPAADDPPSWPLLRSWVTGRERTPFSPPAGVRNNKRHDQRGPL